MNFLLVFIGGGIGSLIRYLIGPGFQKASLTLPIATLASNIIACVIFALTLNFIEHSSFAQGEKTDSSINLKLLVLVGLCGGLSTFSSFGYETFLLLKQQSYLWVVLNILLSLLFCIGSFILIKNSKLFKKNLPQRHRITEKHEKLLCSFVT
jgi:CrcB protein